MNRSSRLKKAFTLVELIIVVAIIGILAATVVLNLNGARAKSRDARRVADLQSIKSALSMYYTDNKVYPSAPSVACPSGYDCNSYRDSFDSGWDALAGDLKSYITTLPKDPINDGCQVWSTSVCYSYSYGNVTRNTGVAHYDLATRFEDPNNPDRCGVKNYHWDLANSTPWCVAFGGQYNNQIYDAAD